MKLLPERSFINVALAIASLFLLGIITLAYSLH